MRSQSNKEEPVAIEDSLDAAISESASRRAWNDTWTILLNGRIAWGSMPVIFAFAGWIVEQSRWPKWMMAVFGAGAGAVASITLAFIWSMMRTPYRQRDEARRLLRRFDVDPVSRAIKSLEALHLRVAEKSTTWLRLFRDSAPILATGCPASTLIAIASRNLGVEPTRDFESGVAVQLGQLVVIGVLRPEWIDLPKPRSSLDLQFYYLTDFGREVLGRLEILDPSPTSSVKFMVPENK